MIEGNVIAQYSDARVTIEIRNKLRESSENYPIPKKRQTRVIMPPNVKDPALETILTTTDFDFNIPKVLPPDEEFRLPAFGLPEPFGIEQSRSTPWYLWVGGAGILCLVFGVVIQRRWRQQPGSK